MTTPNEEIYAVNTLLSADVEQTQASPSAEIKSGYHMGRPRKSPEGRSKKLTIYITGELEEDVKDLARIEGTTTPDYVFRLIEREAKNRANDLELIRNMRQYRN